MSTNKNISVCSIEVYSKLCGKIIISIDPPTSLFYRSVIPISNQKQTSSLQYFYLLIYIINSIG